LSSLKLDLHDIFNDSRSIERALNEVLEEALEKHIRLIEIIPGKGSGQLKKRVLRFFEQPEKKKLYHRLQKDSKNFGRIFVHLKF
jgi:DNA-nicking Smr family endonuclease